MGNWFQYNKESGAKRLRSRVLFLVDENDHGMKLTILINLVLMLKCVELQLKSNIHLHSVVLN
jgi:hypothetical protein